jgi:hypothetical protein
MIKSRRIRWAELVAQIRERRDVCRLLGKPGGKRPLGRPKHTSVDNNKMDLGVIEWDGMRIQTSGELL